MGVTEKTAILVISFGTSYEETRKKTIEQIESDLHHAFPEYPLYRAWTSPVSAPNSGSGTGSTLWILMRQ